MIAAAVGFAVLVSVNSAVIAYVTSGITLMKDTFKVSDIEANIPLLAYPIVLLFGPLVVWLTRRFGPIKILWAASFLSVMSALSAISATNYYGFLFLAILSALPQVLINCNHNTVARCFISPKYRATYLALLQIVRMSSYSVGFCIGVLWIQEEEQFKTDFRLFQIVPFFIATACLVLYSILWYKSEKQGGGTNRFSLARMATDRGLSIDSRRCVSKRFTMCWITSSLLAEGLNEAVALIVEQLFQAKGFSNSQKLIGGILFFVPAVPVPYLPAFLINNMSFRTSLIIAPLIASWTATVFALLILVPMGEAGLFSVIVLYSMFQNVVPTFATAGTEQFDTPFGIDILNNAYSTGTASMTLLYTLFYAILPQEWFVAIFIAGILCAPSLLSFAEKELLLQLDDLPL